MDEALNKNAADLRQITEQLAMELVYAEPGKDTGLLPVNCFLSQIEQISAAAPLPPPLPQAISLGRQWLEAIFNTTGLYDADSLKRLTAWCEWMQSACEMIATGVPPPALPPAWSIAPRSASTPVSSSQPTAPPALPDQDDVPLTIDIDRDAELLREFMSESHEHLQNIELGVLTLEENPNDVETLRSIFRAFHTFKGGSGLLNLVPVNRLAHELESLLDLARQGKLAIDSSVINLILAGGDLLGQFTAAIENQLSGASSPVPIVIPIRHIIAKVRAVVQAPHTVASATVPVPGLTPKPVESAPAAQSLSPSPPHAETAFVKVATPKLDSLVDLVGEMVIAQSMVAQDPALHDLRRESLTRNLSQLGRITTELQRIAMSLRMVPIRSTFQKMHRLVRDLGAKQGKQVELKLNGEDTELDRTIVEQLNDPLVHMIRNSVDHGIESPETRLAQGKPAQGSIQLSAWHQGGSIVIEISDDGGGLNRDRILAKAIAQGMAKPDEPLTDQEIFHFIFAPGFSTAAVVSDVSGRGVGMDVVQRHIETLRGRVEIQSQPGVGSSFTIFLPLTLAIIDGLLVVVGEHRYILPALMVHESFRPAPDMISTVFDRGEMVNVRGHLLPLLRLHEYFGVEPRARHPAEGIVVVVGTEHEKRCLLVDQLLGKQEVVIKSLGETFKNNRALAGAAILGDGRAGLILDIDHLLKRKRDPLKRAA